jgi:hypothetical protein
MSEMTDVHFRCVTLRLELHDSAEPRTRAVVHRSDKRLRYAPGMTDALSAWLTLVLAGLFEIAWAYSLKHAEGSRGSGRASAHWSRSG